MTKHEEILAGLDGLKDYVNDSGKLQIEGLKAKVRALEAIVEAVPKAEVAEAIKKAEEVDPGLEEQELAEELDLTSTKKKAKK